MLREIVKKSGIYSVALMGSRALSFLLLPVYTRYLTPGDYGVMELLDFTVNLASLLVGGRIGQALFYFYFKAETEEQKQKCLSTAFLASLLLTAICAAVSLFASPALSTIVFGTTAYTPYFRLVFFGLGFSMPVEMGYCTMRTFGHSAKYVTANLCYLAGTAVLNLMLLIGFGWGVRAMLTASLVGSLVAAVYMASYVFGAVKVSFEPLLFWRLVRYGIPLGASGLAVFFIHYGDRVFLRHRISLDELGIYSLAYKIGMLISFCHAPFVLHWNSQVCAILKAPAGDRVYARSLTYVTAGLSAMVVALSLFIQPGLRIIVTPAFYGAGVLVPWLAAAYLMRSLGAHLQSVFTAEGRPDIEARVNIVAAVACVGAYSLLIPRFKVSGAVAATLVGFGVTLGYGFWEAQSLRPFQFEYQRLLRISLFTVCAICAFFALRPEGFWGQCALAFVVCTGHLSGLIFLCFDRTERATVAETLARLRAKYSSRETEPQIAV